MEKKIIIAAEEIAPNKISSIYPEPFKSLMGNRIKRRLGDYFGLSSFGVNLTVLKPNGISALLHMHDVQDEFIYILEGEATLITDEGEFAMQAGTCAGFKPKTFAHQLVNKSDKDVIYLEIGDRQAGDAATYPNDDIAAHQDEKGQWIFTHKDGTEY